MVQWVEALATEPEDHVGLKMQSKKHTLFLKPEPKG